MVRDKKREIDHKWVKNNNGSIAIVFSHQKTPYKFAPVRGGNFSSDQDRAIATQIARQIELDIKLGKFAGIEPWLPKQTDKTGIDASPYTINDVWRDYKINKVGHISLASQKSVWLQTDRCLQYLESQDLSAPADITKISLKIIIHLLQKKYSTPVISRALSDLHAACNLASKRTLISSNPLTGYKEYLPKLAKSPRSKECYSQTEVQNILEAFKDNHYKYFVKFLFLTGARPQLAIALTWGDIKSNKIIFDKGFTNGELTRGKTGRVTHFPIYPQLQELLEELWDEDYDYLDLKSLLLFPSPTGKNINLRNFTRRIWTPVINSLVESGKVSKYLPTYHCRHSTATFLAKAGIPSSTIAALLDTSEVMLNRHYLDSQELTKIVIPDFLGNSPILIGAAGFEPTTPTTPK